MLARTDGGGARPTVAEAHCHSPSSNFVVFDMLVSARGNVFRLRPPSRKGGNWAFSMIYTFKVIPDGELPASDLVFDGTGDLYGTTEGGGSGTACGFYGCGTVFEVSP